MNYIPLKTVEINDYIKPNVTLKRKVDIVTPTNQALICVVLFFEDDNGDYGPQIDNGIIYSFEKVILFRDYENGIPYYVNPDTGIKCMESEGTWTDLSDAIVESPQLRGEWWINLIKIGALDQNMMQQIIQNEDQYNKTFDIKS